MSKILKIMVCIVSLYVSMHAKTINLVWQFDRAGFSESDWITELLEDMELNSIDDGKYAVFVDNAVVVISATNRENSRYFQKLKDLNYKFGIIAVGDERYTASTDYYKHAQFVFRHYWHKKFASQKNVYIFPLGYKTGFWKDVDTNIKSSKNREYIWSFAGQIKQKPTRKAMIHAMKTIPRSYTYETFSFGDPKGLSPSQYHTLLLNTIFVPCPTGWWNLDSFRIYEALESGCIPIVERKPIDYFGLYFGKHPFLVVDSWTHAPALINALMADPIKLEEYRIACYRWWVDYVNKVKADFKRIITDALDA